MLGCDGDEGIINRAVDMMFAKKLELEDMSRGQTHVSVSVELLEVYNEKVRDLLSSDRESELKVTSEGVSGNIVSDTESQQEVLAVLNMAQERRCVKETAMNSVSSRSHMIFTLHFHMKSGSGVERMGKLNICDLAGSERLSKSGAHIIGVSTSSREYTLLRATHHFFKGLSA